MDIKELLESDLLSKDSKERVISELLNRGETELPFKVGEKYLFRTVTHIQVGEITSIKSKFISLKDASWIADTGRFSECIENGTFNEIEPVGECFVNAESLIDAFIWKHDLPNEAQ